MKMKVLIKTNDIELIPKYSKPGDAGMDLYAADNGRWVNDEDYSYLTYKCGISIKVPEGYVGLIFPRSSISKTGLSLANAVGVIDSGYTGEISCRFRREIKKKVYYKGDKIAQLIILPYPQITFEVVNELPTTDRGDGGFGSTGT